MDMYCQFYCPNCRERILLPHESLVSMHKLRLSQTSDIPHVAFPCPHCKQLRAYSLHPNSPAEAENSDVILIPPPGIPLLCLAWLRCVEETCEIRVQLLAPWNETTTVEERKSDIDIWIWDHLLCPQGHSIRKPNFRTRE